MSARALRLLGICLTVGCLLVPTTGRGAEDAPGGEESAVESPSDRQPSASDSDASRADSAEVSAARHRRDMLIASLTIFVLAIFVGFEVITKVPPTLHTPLMSGSNAISGITIVGALIIAGHGGSLLAAIVGLIAVVLATINVVGGFLVTHRMLAMFKKR